MAHFFRLSWDHNDDLEDLFEIEWAVGLDEASVGAYQLLAPVVNPATHITWPTDGSGYACDGERYYQFRVKASNPSGDSPWSNEITLDTRLQPVEDLAVEFNILEGPTIYTRVTWTDVNIFDEGYYVRWRNEGDTEWIHESGLLPAGTTSHQYGQAIFPGNVEVQVEVVNGAVSRFSTGIFLLESTIPGALGGPWLTTIDWNHINIVFRYYYGGLGDGTVIFPCEHFNIWCFGGDEFTSWTVVHQIPFTYTTTPDLENERYEWEHEILTRAPDTQYSYYIEAVNGVHSRISGEESTITTDATPVPAPDTIGAVGSGPHEITVSWTIPGSPPQQDTTRFRLKLSNGVENRWYWTDDRDDRSWACNATTEDFGQELLSDTLYDIELWAMNDAPGLPSPGYVGSASIMTQAETWPSAPSAPLNLAVQGFTFDPAMHAHDDIAFEES